MDQDLLLKRPKFAKLVTLGLLTSMFLAGAAKAAGLPATPTTLPAVFAKAAGGDVLLLAPGTYGFGEFSRKFAKPLTIRGAIPSDPPVFRSLDATAASNIVFESLRVRYAPDASTLSWSWATRIRDSDHITFRGFTINGGPAVAGLNEEGAGSDLIGPAADNKHSGNIVGRPTAYGVLINHSSDVLIEGGEISNFNRGVVLQWTQHVTVRGVELHDMRTTAIVGADNSDLTIDGNYMHSAHPWRWGNGDHADMLALWSNWNQTTPNARVRIINNRMEQLQGEPILGMWFQGEAAAPFIDFEISHNQITVNNLQGILLSNSRDGNISGNILRRASGGGDPVQSPTILLRGGVSGVAMSGNSLGAPISDLSKGSNPVGINAIVKGDANIFKAGSAAAKPAKPETR